MPEVELRVGVATTTRFHMFDLARQMLELGQKTTLFTAYPPVVLEPPLRQVARTHSRWLLAVGMCRRLRLPDSIPGNIMFRDYTAWLGQAVHDCHLDVLDVLDGLGLHARRV